MSYFILLCYALSVFLAYHTCSWVRTHRSRVDTGGPAAYAADALNRAWALGVTAGSMFVIGSWLLFTQ